MRDPKFGLVATFSLAWLALLAACASPSTPEGQPAALDASVAPVEAREVHASVEARSAAARLGEQLGHVRRAPLPALPGAPHPAATPDAPVALAPLSRQADGWHVRPAGARPQGALHAADVTLPAHAHEPLTLRDVDSGVALRATLRDAREASAELVEGQLVYPAAHASGADLVHRATAEGTEDHLLFASRPAREQVTYDVALGERVAGLRLVADTLELLDGDGAPRLRVAPPWVLGADGEKRAAHLAVEGCAVDTSPAAPWGRAVVAPGATRCAVVVEWKGAGVAYPAVLDPGWTTTGNMGVGRYGHVAATLANGKLLVATGYNGSYLATSELYDPATGTWAATGTVTSSARYYSVGVTLGNGKVLIAGGYNGSVSPYYLANADLYDPALGTWAATAALPSARYEHAITLLASGKALVTGGTASAGVTGSAAVYDAATAAWTTSTLATARYLHGATLLANGKVLVSGGYGASYLATCELYDPATNAWSAAASMTGPRYYHSATLLPNGKLLAAGGYGGASYLATAELYDPTTNVWSATASMASARYFHTANPLGVGGVLAVGGYNGTTYVGPAEIYNATAGTWSAAGTLVYPRYMHTASNVGSGKVVVTGGDGATSYMAYTEVYSYAQTCATTPECTNGGTCADGYCCNTACLGGCDRCDAAGKEGTCSPAAAGSAGASPSCFPFACDGASGGCPTACTSDTTCATGYYCTGGACVLKLTYGAVCSAASQCQSGYCSDGYCCTQACAGGCDVCAASLGASANGSCTQVAGAGSPSCSPYVCKAATSACPTSCTLEADCIAGDYCSTAHTCLAKKANALACTAANECVSGLCADGYCCDGACGGGCDRCDNAGQVGHCSAVPAGNPGYAPACGVYVCDGASASCPTSCATSANCASTSYCSGGACIAKQANGTGCSATAQCSSGNCVEGVCCNTACAGACDACTVAYGAATNGVCALVTGAGNPSCAPFVCGGASAACPSSCATDAGCTSDRYCGGGTCVPKLAQGSVCTAGNQCTTGACADGFCCGSACSGACDTCSAASGASANGTCTNVAGAGTPACTPYLCKGATSGCPSSCGADADCASGYFCGTGNVCKAKQANGATCARTLECSSGFCADGVCCTTACAAGACDRCDVPGWVGNCRSAPAGDTGSGGACSPFVCNGTALTCPTSCASDAGCIAADFCEVATGTCKPRLAQGSACTAASQCASGSCADGVCCDTACAGGCDRCDLAATRGTCTVIAAGSAGASPACAPYLCDGTHGACPASCAGGAACAAGSYCAGGTCRALVAQGGACSAAAQCATGICVDGVCCNTSCGGQCENCAATGSVGTCAAVAGDPYGARPACAGAGTACGGRCDGVHASACAFPGAATVCGVGGCSGATANPAPACNGAGGCTATPSVACAPFACGGAGACLTSCTTDAQCTGAAHCVGGTCVANLPPGTACTASAECASNNCVDGVCCTSPCDGQCEACNAAGSAGTCTAVAGSPRGARPACAGTGTACAGTCDGSARTSCHYPDTQTSCSAATCAAGVATAASSCTGTGVCAPGAQTTCSAGCDGVACAGATDAGADAALDANADGAVGADAGEELPPLDAGTSGGCAVASVGGEGAPSRALVGLGLAAIVLARRRRRDHKLAR